MFQRAREKEIIPMNEMTKYSIENIFSNAERGCNYYQNIVHARAHITHEIIIIYPSKIIILLKLKAYKDSSNQIIYHCLYIKQCLLI